MKRVEKGTAMRLAAKFGCTRQYASAVIASYRKGTMVRGEKARKIINTFKKEQEKQD